MIVRKARNGVYWQLWWVVDGKRHVESIGKLTERDAERKRQDKAIELDKNPALAAGTGSMKLSAWIDRYLSNRRGDISDATVNDITSTKRVLARFFTEDPFIGDVDKTRAVGFYNWLKTRTKRTGTDAEGNEVRGPIAVDTIRKHMRNCKTIWNYAAEVPEVTGVKLNPFKQKSIKSGVAKSHKGTADITAADFAKIIDACPSSAWRCMFALAFYGMLRSNEARALKWSSVDWASPARMIVQPPTDAQGRVTENTTKKRHREVPICPELYRVLREDFENSLQVGPCEGLPTDAGDLSRQARAIVELSGVANYGPPLHTLRAACVSRWVNVYPAPKVAYWAGHSVQVMQVHYVRPSEDDFALVAGDDKARRIAQLKAELAAMEGAAPTKETQATDADAEKLPF